MRSLIAVLVCACLFNSAASAQDATDWTGFYAGVLAGGASGEMSLYGSSFSIHGATASVLAGYRSPMGMGIAGIEGQANFGGAGFADHLTFLGGDIDYSYTAYPGLALIGSFGVPFGNVLPFAFAGASIAAGAYEEHLTPPPNMPPLLNSDLSLDAVHLGFVLGAGVDVRLNDRLLLRGQYSFTNMMKASYSDPSYGSLELGANIHSVGAGLLYQF